MLDNWSRYNGEEIMRIMNYLMFSIRKQFCVEKMHSLQYLMYLSRRMKKNK